MMEPSGSYEQAEFDWQAAEKDIEQARKSVLSLLSPTPAPRDEIIHLSGFSTALVTAALLEMELNGDAIVEADGRVALSVSF